MSDPIKAGDLVVVVRATPCCDDTTILGHVYRVVQVGHSPSGRCGYCQKIYPDGITDCVKLDGAPKNGWAKRNRLKRIPPLGELDGIKREEDITA